MKHAIEPSEAQLATFLKRAGDGPVHMVNLLKFRARAAYADGRDPELPGVDAYMRYGAPMTGMVEAAGGTLKFSAMTSPLLVGELDEKWDVIAIMTYPSAATLVEIASSPEYAEIAVHRHAGLEGQLLVPCFAAETFAG